MVSTDDLDKLADCSGDELNEVVSSSTDTDKFAECSADEEKLHLSLNDGDVDSEVSEDEEIKVLVGRKKQLEEEKRSLKDVRNRKRQLREQKKAKLKVEVETLESEVAELNVRGFQRR